MIFQLPPLERVEKDVISAIEQIRISIRYALHTPARWLGVLRRNTFARAIRGSNSIEGYNVSVEDAMAAADDVAPAEAEGETWAAVKGYRDAMTYVLRLGQDPHFSFNEGLIKSLHFMMVRHDLTKNPGSWRPSSVYVRNEARDEIVYEGPPADSIPGLMAELFAGLNAAGDETPPLIRAAMSHLNLAMIHPFSDGNGRMARCLQTLVLAREGVMEPQFSSIEEYLGRNTREYYEALSRVGRGGWQPQNDSRPWLRFCLTAHYRQAKTISRRIEETRRIWDELERVAAAHKLPERSFFALFDAAVGFRVRNNTYRSAADVTEATASRDLKSMVGLGLLVADGATRGRAYRAAPGLIEIGRRATLPRTVEDPFVIRQHF